MKQVSERKIRLISAFMKRIVRAHENPAGMSIEYKKNAPTREAFGVFVLNDRQCKQTANPLVRKVLLWKVKE